ncbi:hypothetical protein [Citreimonas salinaria]|uniref:Surface antigen domain-containing protein n=1 Tax=Citreimonas salinaria TaxID=321339 RepID=A0A1H3LLU9_9RHOB|nr:hypothetical protein [Citreimonas salinaria]SDY64958.1 hypothetical protein SAMN05444340_11369 [Citreimonas salinaria]
MRAAALGLVAAAILSGCATAPTAPQVSPALVSALDSRPDGYQAATSAGQRFTIESTAVSDNRLCRVVSFEQPGKFHVDTYCKSRGGTWR